MHKLVKRIPAPILQDFKTFENLSDYYCNWESALQEDRVNQCITLYHCGEGQKFESQNVMPIDIDHIDIDRLQEYRDAVQAAIGINKDDFVTVFTGHGVHCIVGLKTNLQFSDIKAGSKNKKIYNGICSQIEEELEKRSLLCEHGNKKYKLDSGIFSAIRTTRLIGSINRKEGLPDVEVTLLGGTLPFIHDLKTMYREDTDADNAINKQMPTFYDSKEVLQGCKFLEFCRTDPEKTDYDQWCAMISILAKLENGEKLCHDYSKLHSKYDPEKTDSKIQSGFKKGYSCSRINEKFEGCSSCKYRSVVRFPLEIKGAEYIATKDSYFRKTVSKGKAPIEIMDAVKYLPVKTGGFYYSGKSHNTYTYDKEAHKWIELTPEGLNRHFAEMTNWDFKINDAKEFCFMVKSKYEVDDTPKEDMSVINLANGVLDVNTMEILPHSPSYLFQSCLPYSYDPSAECPKWLKFLDEITMGNEDKMTLLQEYAAYCIFYNNMNLSKMLFLVGEGQNGKGVFTNILKELIGQDQTLTSDLDLLSDKQAIEDIRFKKLFLCNEVEFGKYLDLSKFKVLVEGGELRANPKYRKTFGFNNTAKLIISCNHKPKLKENGTAILRRTLVCNFNRSFTDEERNINLTNELKEELSGILNWAVKGFTALQDKEGFEVKGEVKEDTLDYMQDEEKDFIGVFCREELCRKEGAQLKITAVLMAFQKYGLANGIATNWVNTRNISTKIRRIFGIQKSIAQREGNSVSKVLRGIAFQEDSEYKPEF